MPTTRPTLFLRVMRLQLLLGATSSLEMSISTLDAALPDFELKLPPCHQRDELPSPTTIQPTALFSLQTFVPTKQPKINQPTNDPSCRPSFRPSNQLHCCKASIALNQPPIITNLRTLQAPGLTWRMPSLESDEFAMSGWRGSHQVSLSSRWRTDVMPPTLARSLMEPDFVETA